MIGMASIKRATLEALLLAARNTFPNEFLALLSSTSKRGKVVDEFVVLPAVYGRTYSSVRLDLLPYDSRVLGSVHSHPGPRPSPSKGDLRAFKTLGEIHLIIASPFTLETVRAFDVKGNSVELELVE
jgi:proteasome lid subunit RPN8/RPN11